MGRHRRGALHRVRGTDGDTAVSVGTQEEALRRANQHDGLDIVPITVKELLEHERVSG